MKYQRLLSHGLLLLLAFSHWAWIKSGLSLSALVILMVVQSCLWMRIYSYRQNLHGLVVFLALIISINGSRQSGPWQEDDFYRYFRDGYELLQFKNPYREKPAESEQHTNSKLSPEILSKINHGHLHTLYPPAAQLLFALTVAVSGNNFEAFLWILSLGGIIFFVSSFIYLLKSSRINKHHPYSKYLKYSLLWLNHPLIVHEWIRNLHYDSWLTGTFILFLVGIQSNRIRMTTASLALAIHLKWVALPLSIFIPSLRNRRKELSLFLLMNLLPFLLVGSAFPQLFSTLSEFSIHWEFNSGPYRWLLLLTGNSALSRITMLVTFLAFLGWIAKNPWKFTAAEMLYWSIFMMAWLSPVANPWYFTWSLPFCHFLSEPIKRKMLLAYCILPLSYLYYADTRVPYSWFWHLEHIIILILILFSARRYWMEIKEKSLQTALSTSEGSARLGIDVPLPRKRDKKAARKKS